MQTKIKQAVAGIGVGAILSLSIANMFPVRNDSIDDRVRQVLESVDKNKVQYDAKEMKEYAEGIYPLIDNSLKYRNL